MHRIIFIYIFTREFRTLKHNSHIANAKDSVKKVFCKKKIHLVILIDLTAFNLKKIFGRTPEMVVSIVVANILY